MFLIVLVLRSFIVEPFRIPSNSMMPTLLTGDFILVNKFDYGIRLPVVDTKVVDIGLPERGDVVVFRFPEDPSTPFIKRVVGLPGDRIAYYDKVLYVNDEPMEQNPVGRYVGFGSGAVMSGASLRVERLAGVEHNILIRPRAHTVQGTAVVPEGHYFVLGDNRDNSRDSRYWGTVPENLLIGPRVPHLDELGFRARNRLETDWQGHRLKSGVSVRRRTRGDSRPVPACGADRPCVR